MALSVSIVIRALNEENHLPKLFDGISKQTRPPEQIILVDSGSTDRSREISSDAGASIVSIDPSDFTFGRALNVGCEAATGEILVFVSAHVYPVDENWLEKLVAPFEENSDVALVYGRQTGDDRNHFSETEIMRRWFPDVSDSDQKHPFCNNANCAVRRSIWKQIPYDESLTGLEDMAWAKRALADGYRLWYESESTIVHVHEESIAQTMNRYRREGIAHKRIFGHQKMGVFEACTLFLANTIRDYMAALPRRCLFSNLGSIPRFRYAQFRGAWLGLRQHEDPTSELKRRFYYPKGFTLRNNPTSSGLIEKSEL